MRESKLSGQRRDVLSQYIFKWLLNCEGLSCGTERSKSCSLFQLETAYRKSDSLSRWFRKVRIDSFRWGEPCFFLSQSCSKANEQYRHYTPQMQEWLFLCTSLNIHLFVKYFTKICNSCCEIRLYEKINKIWCEHNMNHQVKHALVKSFTYWIKYALQVSAL